MYWKYVKTSYIFLLPGLSPLISTHSNSKSIHPRSPQLGVVTGLTLRTSFEATLEWKSFPPQRLWNRWALECDSRQKFKCCYLPTKIQIHMNSLSNSLWNGWLCAKYYAGTVRRRTSPLKPCQNAGWPSCWNGKLELHFWDIKVKRCCSKPPGKSLWAFRDASECQCKRVDRVQCSVWLQTSRLSVCVCAEMFGNFLSIYACSLTVLSICMWFLIEYLKAWPAMKKLMPLRLRLVSSITASWMFQLPIAACEPTKRITSGEIDRVDFNLLQHQFFSWFLLVNLPISTHFFLSSWHLLVQCGGIRSSRQSNALRNANKLGN